MYIFFFVDFHVPMQICSCSFSLAISFNCKCIEILKNVKCRKLFEKFRNIDHCRDYRYKANTNLLFLISFIIISLILVAFYIVRTMHIHIYIHIYIYRRKDVRLRENNKEE